ncbi:BRISC complex subunit Abraxas 2-like [Sycon ciliatum]|uniref:BRISC complex subunit Abraxas 2-like n=1 Tax=Sycon ciliatum TaxID=27933 RepID=UPI0031F6749D
METHVAGPVLATIMYELANCASDTAGVLLGRVDSREVSSVSDTSDVTTTEVTRTMIIEEVATCHDISGLWYRDGSINEDAFDVTVPQEARDRIVGWYRYRRHTREVPTIRETSFHQALALRCTAVPPSEFVFNLWSWKLDDNSALHTYLYTFFRNIGGIERFQFPVSIVNLGSIRKLTYKDTQSSAVACHSASETMQRHVGDHAATSRDVIETSYRALLDQLKASAVSVGECGHDLDALSREVESLRIQVAEEEKGLHEERLLKVERQAEEASVLVGTQAPPNPALSTEKNGTNGNSEVAGKDCTSNAVDVKAEVKEGDDDEQQDEEEGMEV